MPLDNNDDHQPELQCLPTLTIRELHELARRDFWCFCELCFSILHPGQKLDFASYLEVMANLMMAVEEGRFRRVVINLPPRHMKSLIVSVLYVAWRLGRQPTAKFITISYGDDLAHDHSGMARHLMSSTLYRRIFPKTVLSKKAVDYARTTMGGYRYATSVGSDITGFGADEIIIDDPMQPDDAASEHVKQRLRSWVQSSVMTRFNDARLGALILVMHRLAPDDLSAELGATADFWLKLPLIAEEREKFWTKGRGKLLLSRGVGEVLNPSRMGLADVERLKAGLPGYVWDSQYQQRPTAGGSGMLSIDKFRRYDLAKSPRFELVIHSWDVGATVSGNASVCTKWGLLRHGTRDTLYLTDVTMLRVELPEVRAAVRMQNHRDSPALIVIDERGVGMGLYQELRREGFRNLATSTGTHENIERETTAVLHPSASKIDRFGLCVLRIDDGRVFIPHAAPWLEKFIYEIAAFPNIPDKDQVDSMTQVIANMEVVIRKARNNALQVA